MTILNVVLVVAATLLGLLLLLLLLVRVVLPWWLRRKFGAMAELSQGAGLAARITLVPIEAPWQQPQVDSLIGQMQNAGFVEVGRYAVPQMPGMQLWAGAHPQDGAAAAIYDHPSLPPFFDLVRVYAHQATCTVTSNSIHDPDNVPPGNIVVADPTLSPGSALVVLRDQPDAGVRMPVDAANFAPVFIELYARSMDHILARRMPDAEQMRRVGERMAEVTGEPMPALDDAQMAIAVRMQRATRVEALRQAVIDRFLESGQIDAREWERLRDGVIVVHELLEPAEAADLARSGADWERSEALVAQVLAEGLSALDTFDRIVAALPAPQRPRLLGEVDHPLYAQVLAVPG